MRASRIFSCIFLSGLFLAGCGDDDGGGGGGIDAGAEDDDVTGDDDVGDDDVGDDDIGDDDIGDDDIGDDDIGDDDIGDDDVGDDDIDGGADDDIDGGADDDIDGGADDDGDAGDGGGGEEPMPTACEAEVNPCDEMATCAEVGDAGMTAECDCMDGYVGNGFECQMPVSCLQIIEDNPEAPSGTYTLATAGDADGGAGTIDVFCEMDTAGGGWVEAFTEDSTWDPATGSDNPGWTMPISITSEGSSMMIDFSDTPMAGPNDYSVRLIIEETADDVDPGLTLEALFTSPELVNFDLTANNRAGLTVLQNAPESDPDAGPVVADCATVTAAWPGLSAAICGATGNNHLVIQDSNVGNGCAGTVFGIGVSTATNCFGWPEAPLNQFPEIVRIWIR